MQRKGIKHVVTSTLPTTYGVGNHPLPVPRPSQTSRRAPPDPGAPTTSAQPTLARLSVSEVALLTGYSHAAVLGWVEAGQLRPTGVRVGGLPSFEAGAVAALLVTSAPHLAWRDRAARGGALPDPDAPLEAGELRLDRLTRAVSYAGLPLSLTPKEFGILACLLGWAGRVVTNAQLLAEVWGYRDHGDLTGDDRDMMRERVTILRGRIDAAGAPPNTIRTIYGVGYIIDRPRPAALAALESAS